MHFDQSTETGSANLAEVNTHNNLYESIFQLLDYPVINLSNDTRDFPIGTIARTR